jgi:hypothetical protein
MYELKKRFYGMQISEYDFPGQKLGAIGRMFVLIFKDKKIDNFEDKICNPRVSLHRILFNVDIFNGIIEKLKKEKLIKF